MAAQNKTPQNLSPDLKEIYDRVMNTSGKATSTPPPPPTAPTTPPVSPPPPHPIGATPATTTKPPTPPVNASVLPTTHPTTPTPPSAVPATTTPPADFLTSTPPRPLQSFGANAKQTEKKEEKTENPVQGTKKTELSKPVIFILIGAFVAAWTFFWIVILLKPFG